MTRPWRIHPHDPERIASLGRAARIPAVVAQLLISRGISDPAQARQFLDSRLSDLRDPAQMPGCAHAAERIDDAVRQGKRVVIYGDYDVDGVSGTAILRQCLKLLGGNVGYYVPSRLEEGYGLNAAAIARLAAEKAELLVTVDCGIGSIDEALAARQCGLELIITDHHEPSARLPEAAAIVHPRLPGSQYPFGGLSGSGVALKLAWAICQRASGATKVAPVMRDFLVQAVGLAALGTVADVVPLVDENRVLVRHGLTSLKQPTLPGVKALLDVSGLGDRSRLDAEDIAFQLAPRLNAAGRLGQAQLAVELLVTDRPDRAKELAQYLDGLNSNRQTLERSVYLAANKQISQQADLDGDSALVLAQHGWHPGVIGIVAGRLAEKYHRPAVLIAWEKLGVRPGIGSARSVPGFDLHAALEACTEHLVSHGGHAAAAGLTIEEAKFEAFRASFCEHVAAHIGAAGLATELRIDAEAPLSAFTVEIVEQIEQLAPFGHGNFRPLLCASGVALADPPRPMGASGRHLAVRLCQHDTTVRAVAFGREDWAEPLSAVTGLLDVAFRPIINAYRGRRSVELHLADWRPTGS